MNYTKQYHLPQWAESDRILMEDFNQAMENVERGLTAAKAAADAAAETAQPGQNRRGRPWPPGSPPWRAPSSSSSWGSSRPAAARPAPSTCRRWTCRSSPSLFLDCLYTGPYSGATLYLNGDTGAKYTNEQQSNGTQGIPWSARAEAPATAWRSSIPTARRSAVSSTWRPPPATAGPTPPRPPATPAAAGPRSAAWF